MRNKTNISFIIPVYNVQEYLDKCLCCLTTNWDNNFEVIIIDDGSTDQSNEICKQYVDKFSFIKLIKQSNKGLSGARNTGINHACGDYLVFLDSDDFLNEEFFLDFIDVIKNEEKRTTDIILIRAVDYYPENSSYEERYTYGDLSNSNNPVKVFLELDKKRDFTFAAWLLVVRRDFLIENGLMFMEGIFHEDELWVPQVIAKARSMMIYDKPIYCYRKGRKESIMNSGSIKKQFDRIKIMDELSKEYCRLTPEAKQFFGNRLSALEFGLIINYKYYQKDDNDKKLWNGIDERTKFLNNGKYRFLLFTIRLFGTSLVMKGLNCLLYR